MPEKTKLQKPKQKKCWKYIPTNNSDSSNHNWNKNS